MTTHSHAQRWIVAYDIRDPKRLQRVWRYLHKEGMRLQYSIYLLRGNSQEVQKVVLKLKELIDQRMDDVRIYPLTDTTRIWGMGTQFSNDGLELHDEIMDKLMQRDAAPDNKATCEASTLRFW